MAFEHPPGGILVLARSGSEALSGEEAGLLRDLHQTLLEQDPRDRFLRSSLSNGVTLCRLLYMGLSKSSAKVLRAFLDDPGEEQYGFGLMRSTRVKSGSLYPILERFERLRWIEGYDESIDEHAEGRPKRRLYRLTALGEREARKAVAEFYRDVGGPPAWVPGIETG